MIVYAFILLYEVVTVALTAVVCRLALRWDRKVGWHLAFFGSVVPAIAAVLGYERSDFLFHVVRYGDDKYWGHKTVGEHDALLVFLCLIGIASIPALLVVRHYRRTFPNKTEAGKSILVIFGSLLVLAMMVRHYRDCSFTVVHLSDSKWHYPETVGDVIWPFALLTVAAVISTWLVVRHYRRRFPDSAQARKHILVMMGSLLALATLFLHYQEIDAYRCPNCFSGAVVTQWRFGLWRGPSVPVTLSNERIGERHFCRDFFPTGHRHEWKVIQSLALHFLGTMRTGLGRGDVPFWSQFSFKYEEDPEFRKFIKAKLQDGSLTWPNLIALIPSSETGGGSPEADALLKAYSERAFGSSFTPPETKSAR